MASIYPNKQAEQITNMCSNTLSWHNSACDAITNGCTSGRSLQLWLKKRYSSQYIMFVFHVERMINLITTFKSRNGKEPDYMFTMLDCLTDTFKGYPLNKKILGWCTMAAAIYGLIKWAAEHGCSTMEETIGWGEKVYPEFMEMQLCRDMFDAVFYIYAQSPQRNHYGLYHCIDAILCPTNPEPTSDDFVEKTSPEHFDEISDGLTGEFSFEPSNDCYYFPCNEEINDDLQRGSLDTSMDSNDSLDTTGGSNFGNSDPNTITEFDDSNILGATGEFNFGNADGLYYLDIIRESNCGNFGDIDLDAIAEPSDWPNIFDSLDTIKESDLEYSYQSHSRLTAPDYANMSMEELAYRLPHELMVGPII